MPVVAGWSSPAACWCPDLQDVGKHILGPQWEQKKDKNLKYDDRRKRYA
ncbi:MAG: hypothetical protein P4L31_02440 [Candidatus Babeliales bacterium]|nr:hypothetical protein [Candidatus Babeliales bacterium]